MKHGVCSKDLKHLLNISVFALCLLLSGLANLFTQDREVSERENRALAQLPEFHREKFFNGEYFTEYENYYADQFFSRDYFVGVRNDMKSRMGFPGAQEVQLVTTGGFNVFEEHITSDDSGEVTVPDKTGSGVPDSVSPAETFENGSAGAGTAMITPILPSVGTLAVPLQETAETPSAEDLSTGNQASPSAAPSAGAPAVPSGEASLSPASEPEAEPTALPAQSVPSPTNKPPRDDNGKTIGKVLIYKDGAYALFPFSEDSANYYVKTLNQFRLEAGDGVTVYSLLAPTSMEFLQEEKFQQLTDSQKDTIEYVNTKLKGVVHVDAYTPLQEHSGEYVYFRTDHHWTALGAYYAYTGFAKAAGFEPVSLDRYQTETIEGYIGSMYETTGSSNLKCNPDTITVYKPFTKNEYNVYYSSAIKMNVIDMSHADKEIKYRVFLSGDRPLGIIKTDVANSRKILVIKDSYGNAMVPFLLPHYEEIYVVDPRQYEKNIFELIQNNGIQEVLFLNYVPILSYYGYIDLIVKVMEAE